MEGEGKEVFGKRSLEPPSNGEDCHQFSRVKTVSCVQF